MNEKLLQFIWQFQYFNRANLLVESGEHLSIIKTGVNNKNQGPDFIDAHIKINNLLLVGNIEIHNLSSHWLKHHHDTDKQYGNVILHVVWENDNSIKNLYGQTIPVLVLDGRVSKLLVERYLNLLDLPGIPCHNHSFPIIDELSWIAWKERLLAERLERKSTHILELFHQSKNHWEEVFWWLLAANFGIRVNTLLFEEVAKSIPINILSKHKHQIHQLEALLMGQANLLNGKMEEDYPIMLQKEYIFLQKMHKLPTITIQPNFLRLRPANFPTIRLAQLAILIQKSTHLFSQIKELESFKEVESLLSVQANDYWHNHYRFNQTTVFMPKALGSQTITNILINTIAPILFTYGAYNKNESHQEKAIRWLMEAKPEANSLIQEWQDYGLKAKSAFDSQALLELTNNYCHQKRCLECVVGNKILKGLKD